MADIFAVIADATRRELMSVLADGGELSVGQMVERLGLTQPTVSKHLRVLREHGLVTVRENGQHRYYRMDASPLSSIESWLVPFLSPTTSAARDDSGTAVFAAWSGVDVGENLGRRLADREYQARSALEGASRRLPRVVRKRLFRRP